MQLLGHMGVKTILWVSRAALAAAGAATVAGAVLSADASPLMNQSTPLTSELGRILFAVGGLSLVVLSLFSAGFWAKRQILRL